MRQDTWGRVSLTHPVKWRKELRKLAHRSSEYVLVQGFQETSEILFQELHLSSFDSNLAQPHHTQILLDHYTADENWTAPRRETLSVCLCCNIISTIFYVNGTLRWGWNLFTGLDDYPRICGKIKCINPFVAPNLKNGLRLCHLSQYKFKNNLKKNWIRAREVSVPNSEALWSSSLL